ncbi:MAG TPA: HDIG domain-containing protein [Thermoanaerobaculia bacterium]|nr:HDIG domain-containing protein [Thermoanaerobaculia bacterium]
MDRPPPAGFFARLIRRTERSSAEPRSWRDHVGLWMALYVLVTTAAFSPGISFRTAKLRAGAIADRDFVAPRDFILPDPEATDRKRTEAAAGVLPVYDRDVQSAAHLEEAIRRIFESARGIERDFPPGKTPAAALRDAFPVPVGDGALRAMANVHFSPDLESRLISAETRLYRAGVVDNKELLLQHRDRGVLVRDSTGGGERPTVDLFSTVEYGNDLKSAIASDLGGVRLSPAEAREVAGFLASMMRPNLTYNAAESIHRRQLAMSQVESVLIKVPRGEVLVRRGDLISPRSARILAAVNPSVSRPESWSKLVGVLLLQLLAVFVFWIDSQTRLAASRRQSPPLLALLAVGIVFALIVRGTFAVTQSLASNFSSDALSSDSFAIPFAAGPILAVLVVGAGPGPAVLFAAVQAASIGVLMGMNFPFALYALAGSLAGIYGMKRLGSRSVLFALGGIVAAANVAAVGIGHALAADANSLWADSAAAVVGGLFVAGLVAFLLPVFENLFHVTTDIRLLELSNQNLPLLRTLAFEAPGTYQHSLTVGHLAEAASEAIGENPLLARVCAYYHDIGKTRMPDYFIENQPRGFNRHDRLEPSMSALIIASHVKEGAELARKSRLPGPILSGIREHHGTKLIRYFYQKALSKVEPGSPSVLESDYRYPGPKPSNRVNGILMIADAVEAASRTIAEPTPAKIAAMVRAISNDCLRDGQFDECDLTIRDLSAINDALVRTVTTMFHHRIDYPGFDFNREAGEVGRPRRSTGGVRLNAK